MLMNKHHLPDDRLSSLRLTPDNRTAAMRKVKGAKKMSRNKLYTGLILIMILAWIAASALAAGNADALTVFFQSQSQLYGYFEQWPAEAQADYSELKESLGLAANGEMKYIVPGSGDLKRLQAERIALDFVQNRASLTEDELSKYSLQSVFYTIIGDENVRKWYVRFVYEADGLFYGQFAVDISSPDGTVLYYIVGNNEILSPEPADGRTPLYFWKAEKGPMVTWTQEDLFKYNRLYDGGTYRMSTADELPMEDAVVLAQKTVKDALGGSGKPIEQYGVQAFIEKKRWQMSTDCWVVWLYDIDSLDPLGNPLCYSVLIDPKEAAVLDFIMPGGNG